jgi:glutamate racemase
MLKNPTSPIGIFDSGVGGLTVAHAIVQQLPCENIIYFGDTAHLPYGDKSAATIQTYSIKIAEWLLAQNCKLILIACNSASAAAYDVVKDIIGSRAIVMNMVDPTVEYLCEHYREKHIGLIGTRQTVTSKVYPKKILQRQPQMQITSVITNLLASAIEEFGNNGVTDSLINEYLAHADLQNIQALLLACTHYPVIKQKISAYFNHQITIIDPSDAVAAAVKKCLHDKQLLNPATTLGQKHFYISDYTPTFVACAKLFFAEALKLEHYPLWEQS